MCQKEPLKGMDRTACGMPDVSYHGENAWQVKNEVSSRQLGVMYSGAGVGDCDCFVAYNMHWLPHSYALPSPGKENAGIWRWIRTEAFLSKSIKLEDQKRIEIRERSIAVLISCEEDKTELRNTNFHSKGKDRGRRNSVSENRKTDNR